MDEETKTQLNNDIEMARRMTDINSPVDVLELANRLIHYQDLIISAIAEYDYKSSQLKGKLRVLQEFMRTSKEHYRNLTDLAKRV
jgi:predicted transcriptional regulator